MLLQQLEQYADRLKLPPRLYSETPIRYIIELDGQGKLLTPELIDTADRSSPSTKRGVRRLTPSIQRAVGIKPFLIADKADYSLGYAGEGAKPARVRQCHEAFLTLLERCATTTGERAVAAVVAFLRDEPLRHLRLPSDLDSSALITFRVDGLVPTDLSSVQTFWASEGSVGHDRSTVRTLGVCFAFDDNPPRRRPALRLISRHRHQARELAGG